MILFFSQRENLTALFTTLLPWTGRPWFLALWLPTHLTPSPPPLHIQHPHLAGRPGQGSPALRAAWGLPLHWCPWLGSVHSLMWVPRIVCTGRAGWLGSPFRPPLSVSPLLGSTGEDWHCDNWAGRFSLQPLTSQGQFSQSCVAGCPAKGDQTVPTPVTTAAVHSDFWPPSLCNSTT